MNDFLQDLDNELQDMQTASVPSPASPTQKPTPNKKPPQQKQKQAPKQTKKDGIKSGKKQEIRGKFASSFPDTKFFLPSLRDGYSRFMSIGGNNETGSKNMNMVQYGDDILLIDCGVQFTDASLPGVNYSVPDVSFLTKYTKNIKGMVVTHAHLDHIGSLKHVLPAIGMPPIYGTRLTLGFIRKQLDEAGLLKHAVLIEVDAGSREKIKIGQFDVEFFKVNHSVPDCAGLYIETPGGAKFMHTGDFKIDHTPEIDEPADLDRIEEIGKRGITLFLSDSTGSTRKGFSMSEKNVGEALDAIVAKHTKGRLIIAAFSSWISRVQQLVDIAVKYDKTIFLSGRSMIENVAIAKELGYLKIPDGVIKKMTPKATEGILPHKQIVITTGSQGEQFSALTRMAEGRHNAVEIVSGDTVVFSSSIVPGNDRSVVGIINKLIKLGANVLTKDDGEYHTGGHAFQEEQKIFLDLVKPKYFAPVYGDLYFRTVHKNTAVSIGFKEENVLMLENGQIVDFAPKNGNVFKSRIKAPIQEIIVDGHGMGVATSHVIKAREKMMDAGVVVIGYKVDKKTKAIMGHIKLETRGLVYIDEVRHIHRMIIKKARDVYEHTVKDVPDIEEKDLFKIIRDDMESFLLKRLDRSPMIIPMVIEV
ncbi:ribonuclease J [Candidatus Gracilibacteria bacterium]|nr:ribonuclease J [Candidatus Gracilibacteria bacterium]